MSVLMLFRMQEALKQMEELMAQRTIHEKYPGYAENFQEYLEEHGITHFKWYEVLNCQRSGKFKEHHNGTLNDVMPERDWWPRIIPVYQLMEDFRASPENEWAESKAYSITVNSSWRCPKYNRAVGGSLTSNHKKFKAGDFDPICELDIMWNWLKKRTEGTGRKYELKRYNTFIHVGARW